MTAAAQVLISGLAQIAVETVGAGPPVVFLHAGVADRRMWRAQIDALSGPGGRYMSIAYDRRGFGETLHADERYVQVDDLCRVLDSVAPAGRAVLVGCSQGGRIAIDMALAHPDRVAGLFLVAPAVSGAPRVEALPPEIQAWVDRLEQAEAVVDVDRINALEAHAWLDGPRAPERRVTGSVRELFLAMNEIALRAERRGTEVEPEPAYPRLEEIAVPTLVAWGDLDFPHIVHSCEQLATKIPRAKAVTMRDTAHLPNLERAAEFNRTLLDFLEGIGR